MKRYKDISHTLPIISPLREDKNGEYVKYEDIIKMMRKVLDNHHILLDIEEYIEHN